MSRRAAAKASRSDSAAWTDSQDGDPEPDPEPPAAPPVIILSENGQALAAPYFQPRRATSSQDSSTASHYNLCTRTDIKPITREQPGFPDDPFPTAPAAVVLHSEQPASTSLPQSPPSVQTTTSAPASPNSNTKPTTSAPSTARTARSPVIPSIAPATSYSTHPLSAEGTSTHHKHTMGSKASKLAPSHGKLQPSQDKQDKAEMAEPSNYYSHRSKSMRRKAGKTGATSATGGSGGGAGGGVGGAV